MDIIFSMNEAYLRVEKYSDHIKIISLGEWTLYHESKIEKMLQQITPDKKIIWDFSGIKDFDSSGVLLFIAFYEKFKARSEVEVVGYTGEQKRMYELLMKNRVQEAIPVRAEGFLHRIGKAAVTAYGEFMDFLEFSGLVTTSFVRYIVNPKNLRYKEIIYHIERSGMNAIFIIALTAFLVGLVISYQSAVELAKFGADIFIVDMAGISITRELGPLITAIVVAGRSGSAYTAQIGAMKITEEISAMRTMGFDPVYFLVLPRILALMIALPLLIFLADIIGIFGSMFAANLELSISYTQFVDRLQEVLEAKHFWIGMIKGPIFAIIIAMIGSFRGFQVTDDTESIGYQTTASVVNSIFFVIAFDALFSVILTEWDI
ncbi:MAG: ABC transporter permease [Campylobacterota bacterium]|nr:ABC transporter permease [Campylobacterota bacterium]